MSTTEQTVAERRRYPRYKVIDVSVVVGERRLGHIMDMSLGGLSFSYISLGRRDAGPVDLGIVFGPDGHYLDKLPCRMISEAVLSKEKPLSPIVIHRRSLEFIDLSGEQKEKLSRFIKAHSNGHGG